MFGLFKIHTRRAKIKDLMNRINCQENDKASNENNLYEIAES